MNLAIEIWMEQKRNLEILPSILLLSPMSLLLMCDDSIHLAHLDLLISGNSLRCIQSLDGTLLIGEIITSIHIFHADLFFRHLQTLLQLRDMEHVVHIRQLWWKLQLICHFTSLLHDLKRTNEPRREFAVIP
jgi:hypothetical protein